MARTRRTASDLQQSRFLLSVEQRLGRWPSALFALQGGLQSLFHKALANVEYGSRRTAEHQRGLLVAEVRPRGIDLEQHVGVLDLVRGHLALADQLFEHAPLLMRETHDIFLVHEGCS